MTDKCKYGKKSTHQWIALERGNPTRFLSDVATAIENVPSEHSDPSWIKDLGLALDECFKVNGEPDLDRLAFLACTGKVEHPVCDEVLWQLTKSFSPAIGTSEQWYGREYKRVDGVKGPGPAGTLASAAFQAKQICVADLYDPKNDLLQHLNLDIRLKAPWCLQNRAASIQVGLLLVIDYGSKKPTVLLPNAEKYSGQMQKQWGWEGSKPTEYGDPAWLGELDRKLKILLLSRAKHGAWDLSGPAKWQGLKLHWFIVTPSFYGESESPN